VSCNRQCVSLFEHTPACLKLIGFVPFIEADLKSIKTHSVQNGYIYEVAFVAWVRLPDVM
jgi:hypothetical protein